jgi:hypothetical protein
VLYLLPVYCWFLACLLFDPENGGDSFFENIELFQNSTALENRRPYSLDHCIYWLLAGFLVGLLLVLEVEAVCLCLAFSKQ